MNRIQRRKLKRSANLRLLFFIFIGAFLLFFVTFTFILPIITPQVEIPALTEEHVFNSITSHDFRGRIDPRLHSIELQEEISSPKNKSPGVMSSKPPTPVISYPNAKLNTAGLPPSPQKTAPAGAPLPGAILPQTTSRPVFNVPPRPRPLLTRKQAVIAPPVPIFQAKVIVGSFTNPTDARMTSDILTSLDFKPLIKERNGKYILQIGSYADTKQAKKLVKDLKNRNFDARIIYE